MKNPTIEKDTCPIKEDIDWDGKEPEVTSMKCEWFYHDDSNCYCSHERRITEDDDRCMEKVCPMVNSIKWD